MKILIQRVNNASVTVDQKVVASISKGLLLLVGFSKADTELSITPFIEKLLNLRLFSKPGENSAFGVSVRDINGGLLVVSQFTLYADCTQGRRPGLSDAMAPQEANLLYQTFCSKLKSAYPQGEVAEGVFGADMKVALENDGPVTVMLES